MNRARVTLLAVLAAPALATAVTGGAPSAVAAPPAPAAPERTSAALRDKLRTVTAELNRLRRGAARFRVRLQLAADELPPTLAARYEIRLSQMERSIQQLTGKVEDLAYQVRQAAKEAKKFRTDVEYRLRALEQGRTATRPARPDASRPHDTTRPPARDQHAERRDQPPATTTLPEGSPAAQYAYAIGLLRKERYAKAAAAFRQFIKRHPRHRLTGNAYYWLGEAYYVRSDYRHAAILFADGYRKFPRHLKAPDMLLKLGLTMARLNKNQQACAALAELRRRFPDAGGYIRRAAAAERRKLGCSA
jgi:tol-pal system protein YbgF